MAVVSVSSFLEVLHSQPLLTSEQKAQLPGMQQQFPDLKALAQESIKRGWLTQYQAQQLLWGKADALVLGPYVLLQRLGEGGMGQVFKARHHELGRTVALKIIRKENVVDAESVGRFQREMQVTSRLEHPNVVRALEAGPLGGTLALIMEYVEGTDLDKLVKERGPLPVAEACDLLRQAALGLQHIHEHGLIHRDIKPSNLLVTMDTRGPARGPLVKILDLGLARLQDGQHGKKTTRLADGKSLTTLTLDGGPGTLGSIDYLSPEQALDFHRVDIRGDIYSLGCTFFFMLTGKPPFGSGPLAIKLMRHQQAEPPNLQEFRSDVPRDLAGLLGKMLAKRPEDRYQTPREVAAALPVPEKSAVQPGMRTPGQGRALPSWLPSGKRLLALAAGSCLVLVGLVCLLAVALPSSSKRPSDRSTLVAQATPPLQGEKSRPPSSPERRPNAVGAGVKVLQGRSTVRDTLIDPAHPDRNLGGESRSNEMFRGETASAFLVRFDLSQLGVSDPVRLDKAVLSFFVWDPHDRGKTKVCAFPLKTPWDESSATWRQAAAGKLWQGNGGKSFALGSDTGPPTPHVVVLPDPVNDTVDPPIEYRLDVTNMVRAWLQGSIPNHGLALAGVSDRTIDDGWHSRFQIYASKFSKPQYTPRLTLQLQP